MLENRFVGPQMRAGEWRRRNHIFELGVDRRANDQPVSVNVLSLHEQVLFRVYLSIVRFRSSGLYS